jgi:hypothetical protein
MLGFTITSPSGDIIRFGYYITDAPLTVAAFIASLPFSLSLFHARLSGQEIWTDNAPKLQVIQENASVFTNPGEVVVGPSIPGRAKTAGCLGIYYGEGRGLDACNIFARVHPDDLPLLESLGEQIWKQGTQTLHFAPLP